MFKTDSKLRIALIFIGFLLGITLVFFGWTLTGKMTGLLIMFLGVTFLLMALWVYNFPYKK